MSDPEFCETRHISSNLSYKLTIENAPQLNIETIGGLVTNTTNSDLFTLLKDDEGLEEPLLDIGGDDEQEEAEEELAKENAAREAAVKDTFIPATLNLSKAILGSGLMVIPKTFQILGAFLATVFLVLVGAATWFTISGLLYSADKTGRTTYAAVIRACCGRLSKRVLLAALIVNCFGLMAVFSVICTDILVGTKDMPNGLVQELLPSLASVDFALYRNTALAILLSLVLLPLAAFVPLHRLGAVNVLGVASVAFFALSSIFLAISAVVQGRAHKVPLYPDFSSLGTTPLTKTIAVLNILPIVLNSDVCHQSVFPAMSVLQPYTRTRMNRVAAGALAFCNSLYLVIAICCLITFGSDLDADVLNNFSVDAMAPLAGPVLAYGIAVSVRIGYFLSLIGSFALCMYPLKHCCLEALLRKKYHTIGAVAAESHPITLPLTVALTVGMYFVAAYVPSIWLLLSLVGSAAATLMAFIFPGAATFMVCRNARRSHRWRRIAAVFVVILGGLLFINGFLTFLV